jgi:hypothetical protein
MLDFLRKHDQHAGIMTSNLNRHVASALYVIPVMGVLLAGLNIWQPYSYWLDELYSVTASALPFTEMFRAMLTDVHPPLYQVLLWVWIRVVSDHESVVRGFSLFCSLSAAIYLFLWSKRLDPWTRVLILAFFTTSWLFVYYSQEARSYSLLLLLATLQIGAFASDDGSAKKFGEILCISMLLAWTHYFGLVLAGTVLCWLFFQYFKNYRRLTLVCIVGIAALAWPLAELFWGSLGSKTGGKFWIQVDGPIGTLAIFIQAMAPVLKTWGAARGVALYVFCGIALISLIGWRFRQASLIRNEFEKQTILKLSFCLICCLAIIMAIDLHTPISTERNYIALLPVFSVLCGLAAGTLAASRYAALVVLALTIVWGKMQLEYSHNLLLAKWTPLQNWRVCAEYIIKNAPKGQNYYLRLSDADDVDRVFNYYVKRLSSGAMSLQRIYPSMLGSIAGPTMVFVGAVSEGAIDQLSAREKFGPKEIMYPLQNWKNSTAVLKF